MDKWYLYGAILIAAAVTYLIRILPVTVIRRNITNRFVRSFLYYVPFVTLAVMTFPAILEATGNVWTGLIGFGVAVVLSVFRCKMFLVAGASCGAVLLSSLIFQLVGM